MKKIFLALFIIVSSVTVASARVPQTLGDSIMYVIGQSEGASIKAMSGKVAGTDSVIMQKSYAKALNDVMSMPINDKYYMEAMARMVSLVTLASDLKAKGIEADPTMAKVGYECGFNAPVLPADSLRAYESKIRDIMNVAAEKAKEIQAAREKEALDNNVRAANAFIDSLKKADKKIKTTDSGLSYKRVKKGKGKVCPADTDQVKVHYVGKLIDGTVFDSSIERGEPATFDVKRVVKGFAEGLKLMTVGSKYTLYIPFNLGYGSRGAGGKIPGGAMLVFDVELLEINPEK